MAYPVMLNVKGKRCLVVGGGVVGARKARGLLKEGARVTVLSSSFHEQLNGITYIDARYDVSHLDTVEPWLVITATDNHDTNAQIMADAHARGAIVMRADDSKAGDAHGVMKRERDGVTITAATGVPTFSRYLMDEIETMLTPGLLDLAAELAEIRAELRRTLPTADDRTSAWQAIEAFIPVWRERFEAGEIVNIREEVEAIILEA
ncbi:MAG: NAD(P)-dependent oxidoreductase [Chloroflexota bacterium]